MKKFMASLGGDALLFVAGAFGMLALFVLGTLWYIAPAVPDTEGD